MFSRCGRRPSGWAVSWPDSLRLGVGRYGGSVPLLPISRTNARKRAPPSGKTKAGIVGCVGSIRLWSLTLQLLWGWAHQQPCAGSQESTCLRAVLRWRIWVTPLKGEWRRQRILHWHAANLTCVNSSSPTSHYGADVWDFWIGGNKWESL